LASLVGLNAALLALCIQDADKAEFRTRATLPLSIITLMASVGVCMLSWFEQDRNTRPSLLLTCYLFFSGFLELPRIRTLWLIGESRAVSILLLCSLALRFILFVLESLSKRGRLHPRYQHMQEEWTRTLIHEAGFWWLNPLFAAAYSKNITLKDLYPLEEPMRSEGWHNVFVHAWDNGTYQRVRMKLEMLSASKNKS
jgi:ATP-binding cassette, subfamily C (CFTR/MRP), member 1